MKMFVQKYMIQIIWPMLIVFLVIYQVKLLHQHSIVHCIDFYGSFLGIQKKFKIDITDDYEYLQSSPFFIANNNKLFHTISMNMDN